jgi:hypothetical protein
VLSDINASKHPIQYPGQAAWFLLTLNELSVGGDQNLFGEWGLECGMTPHWRMAILQPN